MKKVAIFGSCVSRDAVGLVPDTFTPIHYTARQSWISRTTPPLWAPPIDRLSSPFQRRMVRDDFHSTLLGEIEAHGREADLVMVDLVDERLGVIEFWPGRFATLSNELSGTMWLAGDRLIGRRRLMLGADEHYRRFVEAAQMVKSRLELVRVWEKTVVIEAPFVGRTIQGDALPPEAGLDVDWWNAAYRPYYDALRDLGFQMIRPDENLLFSDGDHKWGPAAYHYQEAASKDLMRQAERMFA